MKCVCVCSPPCACPPGGSVDPRFFFFFFFSCIWLWLFLLKMRWKKGKRGEEMGCRADHELAFLLLAFRCSFIFSFFLFLKIPPQTNDAIGRAYYSPKPLQVSAYYQRDRKKPLKLRQLAHLSFSFLFCFSVTHIF